MVHANAALPKASVLNSRCAADQGRCAKATQAE